MSSKLSPPVGLGDHEQGSQGAAVVLVEFGDYECQHTAQAREVVKDLRAGMGLRLRYVWRHFPLRQNHPHAQVAAEAAEAAAAQGKFWEMHELLLSTDEPLETPRLIAFASELGLDVDRFTRELRAHTHATKVQADLLSGVRSAVNGTPTFFINGVRHDGEWEGEALRAAIDSVGAGARA